MNKVLVLAEDLGVDVSYSDTDSMILPKEGLTRVIAAYKERYGTELDGEDLGQMNSDLAFDGAYARREGDGMLIPNTKKAVGDITATTGVFIAKKTYLLRLEDEAGNVCYQYRIKGHPHGAIQGLVNNSAEFEGDVQKLYESAYGGAEYVVDFCCKPLRRCVL